MITKRKSFRRREGKIFTKILNRTNICERLGLEDTMPVNATFSTSLDQVTLDAGYGTVKSADASNGYEF